LLFYFNKIKMKKNTTKNVEVVMPFYYVDRNQILGQCKLTINHNLSIVMITQIANNKAESITNSAKILATSICQYFKISKKKLMLLERWTDKESYGRNGNNSITALVTFYKDIVEIEAIDEEYVTEIFEQ
jgi:hypothetical protein